MTLPNFLIIGAAKSGTTALYEYLKQHPDIFFSNPKELRYFSYSGSYPKNVPEKYLHKGVTSLLEYKSYFDAVKDEVIIGEASPMYLYTPGTSEKIKEIIPNAKLLAILRNPVDRALSAYTHAIREWKEPAKTFEEALSKESERIDQGWGMLWHYINAGYYYKQLLCYYNNFPKQNIKVVLYDDLTSNCLGLLKDIFNFLEVDPSFSPNISNKPNVSGYPKNASIHNFMRKVFEQDNLVRRVSRKVFPREVRKRVIEFLRLRNMEKRIMSDDVRDHLISIFKTDIHNLETLIDRDLSNWLNK